jgi:hypothetical protein
VSRSWMPGPLAARPSAHGRPEPDTRGRPADCREEADRAQDGRRVLPVRHRLAQQPARGCRAARRLRSRLTSVVARVGGLWAQAAVQHYLIGRALPKTGLTPVSLQPASQRFSSRSFAISTSCSCLNSSKGPSATKGLGGRAETHAEPVRKKDDTPQWKRPWPEPAGVGSPVVRILVAP